MSKTPNVTFVYLSKCNIKLPGIFGNSKNKPVKWSGWSGEDGRREERRGRDGHLNLTFLVTCAWQLPQFLQYLPILSSKKTHIEFQKKITSNLRCFVEIQNFEDQVKISKVWEPLRQALRPINT